MTRSGRRSRSDSPRPAARLVRLRPAERRAARLATRLERRLRHIRRNKMEARQELEADQQLAAGLLAGASDRRRRQTRDPFREQTRRRAALSVWPGEKQTRLAAAAAGKCGLKFPGTRGMWPAIWLLPDGPWPSEGEIDIMENRGNQPTITSSAFHWGTASPYSHHFFAVEQQTSLAGKLVRTPMVFTPTRSNGYRDQLRFYVDDVYHTIFYNDECGDVLPELKAPMRLVINTAIGGDFLPPPDEIDRVAATLSKSTGFASTSSDDTNAERTFVNGDFEAAGGTLAGWHVFGNRIDDDPNVLVHSEAVKTGRSSLKLSGQSSGGENYSGVSQGISVSSGDRVRARLAAFVRSQESLANSQNRAFLKIEFYNHWGDYFGGPAMLGVEEQLIADADTPTDQWIEPRAHRRRPRRRRRSTPLASSFPSQRKSLAPSTSMLSNSCALMIDDWQLASENSMPGFHAPRGLVSRP